jgi:hypothetical protein
MAETKWQKCRRRSRGSVSLGNDGGFRPLNFAGPRFGQIRTNGRNRRTSLLPRTCSGVLPFLPNLVPSDAAKFKPCTGNGLRSIFGFLSFCRRLNDMVFLSSSPVGRRWTAGKGPVRPRTIGRDSIDQGISQPVRRGNGRQKDPPVRRRAREGRLDRAAVFAAEAVGLLDRKGPADRLTRAPFTTLFFVAGRRLLARTSAAKDPSAGPVGRPYPTRPVVQFLEIRPEIRIQRAWGQGAGDSLSNDPTPVLHRISNYSHPSVAGTTVVYRGGKRDDSGCPVSAQRLACTVARMRRGHQKDNGPGTLRCPARL